MGGDNLYEDEDPANSRGIGMAGTSDPTIQKMTCSQFLQKLYAAVGQPNYYSNTFPYNCGYYDGQKYSFDCWNLINSVLGGWYPSGAKGSYINPTSFPAYPNYSGSCILEKCSERSKDFSKISVPGTYMFMYKGHAGTYIGPYIIDGHVVNVIECTSDWDHGVQYTYVDARGGRYKYMGGPGGPERGWTSWSEYGLLPWIDYSDVGHTQPPQVATGQSGPTGNEIYDLYGPITNAEYIERRQLMDPRLEAPKLTATEYPIYEDDTYDGKYIDVSVDKYGITHRDVKLKKIKYDGRDLWYVSKKYGGWSPSDSITEVSYVWSRFSEAMDPDPNNMLIKHIPCNLTRGLAADAYRCEEDGYTRNVAPAVGAVMCFYSKKNHKGHVCIVEKMMDNGTLITSEWNNGRFELVRRQKRYGFWDYDDFIFQGFIHNPACTMEAMADSALDTFCSVALNHIGSGVDWIQSTTQLPSNSSPSAALVVAVAKEAGSTLNIVVPNTFSVSSIGRIGVLQNMGTWINGPANGANGYPEAGDIAIIRTHHYNQPSIYQGDLAGIVTQVHANGTFDVVMIEKDIVTDQNIKITLSRIAGYFRPDWGRIDGTSESVVLYRNLHGLYTDGVTIEDACAREVCYLKDNLPSIKRTGIRLSAINYTGLLSNMYTVFATSSTSDAADSDLIVDLWTTTLKSWFQEGGIQLTADSASVISTQEANNAMSMYTSPDGKGTLYTPTAEMSGNVTVNSICGTERTIYDLLDAGTELNPAAICAIIANIYSESLYEGKRFNCGAKGDWEWTCPRCGTANLNRTSCKKCGQDRGSTPTHATAFGLCQWRQNRATEMKNYCMLHGGTWETNLSGQIGYLIKEMKSRGLNVRSGTETEKYGGRNLTEYTALMQVSNNTSGLYEAVAIFVISFERPADTGGAIATRTSRALEYWNKLVQ